MHNYSFVVGLDNASLESIIAGCREDSWRHKELLYKGYYGYIKGVIIRYVDDFHEVEELVNDSFLKIFSNLSRFNGSGQSAGIVPSFKSWIARIASRTAIDFLRKKKIVFGPTELNENNVPLGSEKYELTDNAKDILRLLNKLPLVQKTIFSLYEIEGFTHEEIAGLLAIPENVSRVYLSRAKNKLKSLYIKNL